MKKRMIALLLVVATLLSMIGAGVPDDIGSDVITTEQVETTVTPTVIPEPTVETTATPEVTVEPTSEATVTPEVTVAPTANPEPTATPKLTEDSIATASEEQEEDNCPYCEETLAEDGTVIHTVICTAAYVYDGTADKGKYVKLSDFSVDYGVMVSGSPATDDGIPFYYDEFGADTIMRITDWYWDAGTTGLWYAVELYRGAFPESTEDVVWPDTPWVLQNYTEDWNEAENSFAFLSACTICGKPDCTVTHEYCDHCEKYDCGITHDICDVCGNVDCNGVHLLCLACGAENCQESHSFCGYCVEYDCGIDHTAEIKPAVSAVIPENPIMTEGADVSIVDEYGDPVTNEGFYLLEGTKASLSAWSDLEGASYQWQIRYDTANDLWVNIPEADEKGILVSAALFCSLEEPALRCVMSSGEESKLSSNIPIVLIDVPEVAGYTARTTLNSSSGGETDQTQGETTTQYKLTIKYILSENCKAAGRTVSIDYVGNFSSAEDVPENIPHPSVPGYAPVVDENSYVYADGYKPDFTDGNPTDVTVTVYYDPAEVTYMVVHYVQGVNNNNYTEVLRETKNGITEQPVAENLQSPSVENVSFDGLHPLSYERPAIAADGSTVIEIYYDRIYYLISFELSGGYGVDPVFDRYGAEMPDVGKPTCAGYTFAGWSLDGTTKIDLPTTIPAENRKYIAIWSDPGEVNVTIVYWRENADDYGFGVWGQKEITATAGSFVNGLDHPVPESVSVIPYNEGTLDEEPYFTLNETWTDHNVEVLGDGSTLVNVYYNRNVYTINFYAVGSCGIPEHTHSNVLRELICTEEHEHDAAACYSGCRVLICERDHDHDKTDCYRYDCRMTVHTHSDGGNCGTYSSYPLIYAITAKYNADISDIWLTSDIMAQLPTAYKNDSGQASNESGAPFRAWQVAGNSTPTVSKRLTMNSGVCATTANRTKKAYALYKTGTTLHLHYMVESFDQDSPANTEVETDTVRRYFDGKYYDVFPVYTQTVVAATTGSISNTTFKHKSIDGLSFTQYDATYEEVGYREYNYFLYYSRLGYDLEFYNVNSIYEAHTGLYYGTPLNSFAGTTPTLPDGWEEGVWNFEGWYTTSNCLEGTKYLFDSDDTMPACDMTLYAKWIPVTHTVTFHQTYEDMLSDTRLSEDKWPTKTVSHGYYLDRINDAVRDGYYFVNWFFIDAETGKEKAFDPENMPVTKDLKLYARWTSSITVEYTVRFCTTLDDGTTVDIADPITNKSLAGQTITYDAKVGGALYPNYQTYYFPQYESQSLTLSKDEDAVNEIVFMYDEVESIEYTIQYLDLEGKKLYPDQEKTTYQAAVTEEYIPIEGYIPDESRKTLILTTPSEGEENVLIFWYTQTNNEGPVRKTHYIAQLNGGWSEYRANEETGKFGTEYSEAVLTDIPGFTYSLEQTRGNQKSQTEGTNVTIAADSVSGTLVDYTGLYLDLYYTRNKYPYLVRYVEDGSYNTVAEAESGSAPYQSLVTKTAKEITGYTLLSEESQTIEIKIEEGDSAVINVITFKYERKMSALKITKEVVATPVGTAPADDEFEFTVKLNGDGSDASATFPQPMYRYDIYNIGDDTTVVTSGVVYPKASTADSTAKDTFKVTLKAGQYALLKGVPTGNYTITEENYTSKDYEAHSAVNLTLNETDTGVAAFTNTYTKRTGDLTVTKTVAKEYEKDTLPDDTFEFTLTLIPDPTTKNKDRDYSYTIYDVYGVQVECDGTVLSTNADSIVIKFSLKSGERIEFKELPIGNYTVSETENTAYITTVNGSASGTITATTEATAEFINTYKRTLGDLKITTDGALFDANDSYIFTVTGSNGYSQKVAINGNTSVTIKDLPYGDYTVTPDTDWSWRYGNMSAQVKKIDASTKTVVNETSVNVVEATFAQSLSIRKWLSGSSYAKKLFN